MELATLVLQPDTGWSTPPDPRLDSPNTLVLVFGPAAWLPPLEAHGPADAAHPLAALTRALPRSVFACTATHTAAHARQAHDGALVACIARFERTTVRRVDATATAGTDAHAIGRQLARQLCAAPDLSGVLVFADGGQVDGPTLVQGLTAELPAGLPVVGGLGAPGGPRHRACAIGLYGPHLRMAQSHRGGSVGFGPRRRVTRAQGHTVAAIDDQPALQLYRHYLGDYASGLPQAASHFPLTVFRHADDTQGVIRYVLGIDTQHQSIDVAGDIPSGSLVQLSRASRSDLLDGAVQAVQGLEAALPPAPVLALVVSCVGRRHVLGEQTEEELETVAAALPAGSALAGFYSFGEIAAGPGTACDMHNMTLTLAALWEAPVAEVETP
jgi:hypothetical protein